METNKIFENLAKELTRFSDPVQVRKDLMEIYFIAADAAFHDSELSQATCDSFHTLQTIIQTLELPTED